jgi:hypothetical protein
MSNQVVHLFKDVDMRNQHNGLQRIAQKQKVRLDALGAGEHVVFLNSRLNKVKLYSHQGVLSYYRSPSGKLNLHIVEQIPACFSAKGGMDWDKADRLALERLLEGHEA